MTFDKLIQSARRDRKLPPAGERPKVGVHVRSAEGYVGRHDLGPRTSTAERSPDGTARS